MEIKMKGKAIICIAMIVAVLASAVGVVSAADESVVEFKDQGYAIKITFPDGEGIAPEGVDSFNLRGSYDVNIISVRGEDIYKLINVLIKVKGVSDEDWSLSKWKGSTTYPFYSPVRRDTTTKKFKLGATSSNMPSHLDTRIYRLTVEEPGKSYYEIHFLLVQTGEKITEIKPTTKEEEYPSTSTESTPAREPVSQKQCEEWCLERYGAGMVGIVIYGQCQCWPSEGREGDEGYVKTAQGWVKATDEDCNRACSTIVKLRGEKLIGYIYNGACKCKCEEGYKFNKEKTKCIKITSTSTPSPTPLNKPPVAHASVVSESRPELEPNSHITVEYGETVIFSAAESYDPDGEILNYRWFWESIKMTAGEVIERRYLPIGKTVAILEVEDNKGAKSTDTVVVTVTEKKKGELLISKLYTSKTEYHIGEEVGVFYNIKNVGTVDVNEYQVEYSILDLNGKTVYEHKGNVHSIATGKEQEWYSSGKWNVPSNAKSGKYTVEALLGYSSESDMKMVSFTVTEVETETEVATVKPTIEGQTTTETIYKPTKYDLDDLDENMCSPREYAYIDKTRNGTMYISCRCKPGYTRVTGGCTFDLPIAGVFNGEELEILESVYRELDANQGTTMKITKDGKTIELGVLRRGDHSLLYTLDGETWDSDIAKIVNPSIIDRIGTLLGNIGDAINPVNWFETPYKNKDKQMQYEIAGETLEAYQEDTKKISQYAYEYYSDAKDKEGAIETLLDGELIKGSAEMAGIETDLLKYTMNFPGQAFTKFADEAQIQQIANGFFVYAEMREEKTWMSPQEIVNDVQAGGYSSWGLDESLGEIILCQLYEESYQRYLLRKTLQAK